MDFAARVNRNTVFSPTGLDPGRSIPSSYMINQRDHLTSSPEGEIELFWEGEIENYGRTEPFGRLIIRPYNSYNERLINERVTGSQAFADELLNTDDYYACFATKYLNFLTGYDLPLDTWPQDDESKLQIHQDIEEWSNTLKTNKDMKNLLINIINSNYFMDLTYD